MERVLWFAKPMKTRQIQSPRRASVLSNCYTKSSVARFSGNLSRKFPPLICNSWFLREMKRAREPIYLKNYKANCLQEPEVIQMSATGNREWWGLWQTESTSCTHGDHSATQLPQLVAMNKTGPIFLNILFFKRSKNSRFLHEVCPFL